MLEFLIPPAAIPGLEFRAALAVAFTATAAYYDLFNKKWVPDWIAYASIAAAVIVNVLFFTPALFTQAMLFGIIVFGLTYALYRAGQLGGADVYIMAAIAATLPFMPKPFLAAAQSVPYPFILSVLIPTGIAFIIHMLLRFIPYISKKIAAGKMKLALPQMIEIAVVLAILFSFANIVNALPVALPPSYIAVFAFLSLALLFFSLFKHEIKASMVETVKASLLQAEDVLAIEQIDAKKVKALSLAPLMDEKMIARIRKAKIKELPVYTGMPFFLPYLLVGLVFALLFGDLFFYLI